MNEFENNNSEFNAAENTASTDNTTEENTTYHYSYKSAQNAAQTPPNSSTAAGGYANQQRSSYYAPNPQAQHSTTVNGNPVDGSINNDFDTKPAKKKSKTVIILISVFILCIIFAVIGIAASSVQSGSDSDSGNINSDAQVQTNDQAEIPITDKEGNLTVAGVAKNCIDSCVGITVYSQATNYSNFYGYGYGYGNSQNTTGEEVLSGEGSGIIMLEDNGKTYIMTCAHVISDGSSFTVTLNDKTEYQASMVGYDAQTDIGVLVINATGLSVANFADSDSTILGEQVVAIGCPGGLDFLNSLSSGYVSALARPISSSIGYNTDCIQIDAAINPGNSGGALFNMQGQVIGVNSSKIAATEYEGMGFAVPSNTAIATANSLIRVGYVEGRAKLGITYKAITSYSNSDAILNALDELGYKNASGTMVINEISAESDLSSKDIQEYDMIVAVNDETMTSTDVMTSVLADSKPGDTVKLTIARIANNQIDTFEIECTLIEAKD